MLPTTTGHKNRILDFEVHHC